MIGLIIKHDGRTLHQVGMGMKETLSFTLKSTGDLGVREASARDTDSCRLPALGPETTVLVPLVPVSEAKHAHNDCSHDGCLLHSTDSSSQHSACCWLSPCRGPEKNKNEDKYSCFSVALSNCSMSGAKLSTFHASNSQSKSLRSVLLPPPFHRLETQGSERLRQLSEVHGTGRWPGPWLSWVRR